MNRKLEQLREILSAEFDLHTELLERAREKQDAIIALDIEKVDDLVAAEELLVGAVYVKEEERLGLVGEICGQAGIDPKKVKMSDVITIAKGDIKVELARLKKDLKSVIREVASVNDLSCQILEDSIAHVNGFFSLITAVNTAHMTYQADGRKARPDSVSLLDHSA